jgi:hypothetical protein
VGHHGARQLSGRFRRPAIRWDRSAGAFRLNLGPELQQILTQLMTQLQELLEDPGAPVLHRLFPPAYSDPSDVALQDEYRRLMMEELVDRRRAECQVLLDTVERPTLSEEELMAWVRTINSLRLALGTYLDVSEDDVPGPPQSAEESAYQWLSLLLEEAVDALAGRVG